MSVLQFLTTVHFGDGERRKLPGELASLGVRRPLYVTDKGVVSAGVLNQAIEAMPALDKPVIFDDTPINPTEAAALAGAKYYHGHDCDGIVGIGGGAALDLAKAVTILASNPPPLWDYCNRHSMPKPIGNAPPLILMPTTSGTGSEVGRSAVIVFDNGIKAGVRCPDIVSLAICDPELTFGLPPRVTAATGMDALSHCIETYCSPVVNPPADAISLDGMQRIARHIERAVSNGRDREARWNMMMGSLEGAISFQKGMGAVHAIAHPLGAKGYHHGTLNAILLPYVLAYNQDYLGEKLAAIRDHVGLSATAGLAGFFLEMNQRIGMPIRLRELEIEAKVLTSIAEAALTDNANKTNPRPLSQADYEAILQAAY